jgi:hypothetical protein
MKVTFTPKQVELRNELAKGRTIGQYPTGQYGITEMLRFDDTKEVINCKTVMALRDKGLDIKIVIKEQIIKN